MEQKWINIKSEEKPQHAQPIIILCITDFSYYPGRYIANDEFDGVNIGKGFYHYEGFEPITVHDLGRKITEATHWMPLHELPKQ